MGRELKRVPLDFKWTMNQVWKGYLNPYRSFQCVACKGTGMSKEMKKISDDWYTHLRIDGKEGWMYHLDQEDVQALIDADRLWNFTRVPINEEHKNIVKQKIADGGNSWLPFNNGYIPTAKEVNLWARKQIGHDGSNQWICVQARAKRLGIQENCECCNGEGVFWQSEEIKYLHDNWISFEPPEGEGYQLWETTSEGSPSSTVFKTLEELCEWCEENATTFGHFKATKEEWISMLNKDFVCHKEGNVIFM